MKKANLVALLSLFVAFGLGQPVGFAQEIEWQRFSPPDIKMHMDFPIEPRLQQRTITPDGGDEIVVNTWLATVEEGNLSYILTWHELPEAVRKQSRTKIYNDTIQGAVLRVGGELKEHETVRLHGVPARRFMFEFSDFQGREYQIRSQTVSHDNKLFQMVVAADLEHVSEEDAIRYFGSMRFQLTRNPPAEPEPDDQNDENASGDDQTRATGEAAETDEADTDPNGQSEEESLTASTPKNSSDGPDDSESNGPADSGADDEGAVEDSNDSAIEIDPNEGERDTDADENTDEGDS